MRSARGWSRVRASGPPVGRVGGQGGDPGRQHPVAVLEQGAVGVDARRAGVVAARRASASSCWPTAIDRDPGRRRGPDRLDPVVRTGGQVDDAAGRRGECRRQRARHRGQGRAERRQRPDRTGSPPARRTPSASRVAQMRSSARTAMPRAAGRARVAHPRALARCRKTSAAETTAVGSPRRRRRPGRGGSRRRPSCGSRPRAVVGPEHHGIGRHELADYALADALAGDLHHRVAIREDPDQAVAVARPGGSRSRHRASGGPRPRRRARALDDARLARRRATSRWLAQDRVVELERGLRQVLGREVGAAVGAGVLALEVVVAADGAEHGRLQRYSTVQVSPASSALARSPSPDFSIACWIWRVHQVRVGRLADVAQDADGHRELRPEHPRQDQREVRVVGVRVVDEQVVLGDAVLRRS